MPATRPDDPAAPLTIALAAPTADDQAGLTATWREAFTHLRDAAVRAPWEHPSVLPGWSVGDIVAHLAWIERILLGRTDPAHEPDWSRLPHVTGDFGRLTEIPVDLRRSRSRDEVLAELDEAVAARAEVLASAGPGPTMNPFGRMVPTVELLGMRIFDVWVHEQDIRTAVGDPGHLDTAAAHVAAARMRRGMAFVWARGAAAPAGATLRISVDGPGVRFSDTIERGEDGRGRIVESSAEPDAVPTVPVNVALSMSFPDFVALACGRVTEAASVRIEVADPADRDLAARMLAHISIAP